MKTSPKSFTRRFDLISLPTVELVLGLSVVVGLARLRDLDSTRAELWSDLGLDLGLGLGLAWTFDLAPLALDAPKSADNSSADFCLGLGLAWFDDECAELARLTL